MNIPENTSIRDATESEKVALSGILSTLPVPKKRYLKATLNTAVFWVFLLTGFFILWFISSIIISAFFNVDIGVSSTYALYLLPIMIITAGILAINSTRQWLNTTVDEYALIKTDLAGEKTNEQTYQVISATCFKEPEFGGLLYFLLLQPFECSDSENTNKLRIKAIYDYESQNENSDPQSVLIIKNKMTICTAPVSSYLFEHHFEGELIEDITQYDLTSPPEQWPEPNSWQEIDWTALQATYSVK